MSFLSKKAVLVKMLLVLHVVIKIGSVMMLEFEADKITSLPGQPSVNFQHYSGYVYVSFANQTQNNHNNQKAMFYYFIEAETEPVSKPLVLWLNGGPGCSSLGVGAFSENGPFRPAGNRLIINHYSWNKEANMLYLETPAGVGFSHSTNISSYETANDHTTARDNLKFLQKWFLKFPHYQNRSLYITGESYAGHYVPQLAELMLQYNKKEKLFNLKGIALGNPVLEFITDFNSRAEYFWSHGLISDSTYNVFTSACNYSRYVGEYYRGFVSPMCSKVMSLVSRETSRFVDKYDVTLDVCLPSIFSQSKFLTPHQVGETIDVCVEDETVGYLNRRDVQKALHARLVGVNSWTVCSRILDYEMLDLERPTIHLIGNLVKAGIPVLIYSGDQDSVVPLTGSRTLVKRLAEELKLNTTVPYRVWFVGKQVGGWTEVHGDLLSFATVRGASHEAPFSQPERSLVLFKSFLEGKPLPEVL
ncbi:serine carboxypeptidase-like 45 [Beta vulgaris subsp. vulgaris]|uniref:serine carboxypeptidase-like 45 n=1 Tax=Beta vulgaris subsp. vulgaris TaxID=3555 RepID=UPI002037445E|nr:serine carboxypeptidase-like 45 [Beta vulgaris subsp. vulgaris]